MVNIKTLLRFILLKSYLCLDLMGERLLDRLLDLLLRRGENLLLIGDLYLKGGALLRGEIDLLRNEFDLLGDLDLLDEMDPFLGDLDLLDGDLFLVDLGETDRPTDDFDLRGDPDLPLGDLDLLSDLRFAEVLRGDLFR